MTYPPDWRVVKDVGVAEALIRQYPFAHIITEHGGLRSTRTPFIADFAQGQPVQLRAHLNARNPQADQLDGQAALVIFDGPASYVSPHWRTDLTRAATYDYEQVQVRGIVRVADDIDFFRRLIDNLAAMIEPQYAEAGDFPTWQTAMSPPGYVERLFPAIRAFRIEITSVQMISKLHQGFPEADRRSIADHLDRLPRQESRAIAAKIRAQLKD
jgi:transcriptional regulator